MAATEAVRLLIQDHGDIGTGARGDFAQDKPLKSILQRREKTLDEMLQIFDWKEDDAAWTAEYDKKNNDIQKLIKFRRRVCFTVCGWREFNEDFGRGDVSCLCDMRTPFVTSRSPLRAMQDEFE